jgi:TrmH family RNA methyltransferase
MTVISSLSNPTIKHIRALRQRKTRGETGEFFVEGIRIVAEALELGAPIRYLVVAPDLLTGDFGRGLVNTAQQRGVRYVGVTAEVFASFSGKDGPQGLGAVVEQRWEPLSQIQLDKELCWVALDAAQDPGNIGTILRTCDAVGGAGLLLLGDSADPRLETAARLYRRRHLGRRRARLPRRRLSPAPGAAHGQRAPGTIA